MFVRRSREGGSGSICRRRRCRSRRFEGAVGGARARDCWRVLGWLRRVGVQ